MKIVKELYKSKTLSDGSHPVVIRISHIGFVKRISTSVKCLEKNWDKKRLCIKSRDANYRFKNQMIDSIERRISGNIQELVDNLITLNFGKMVSQISTEDMTESSAKETLCLKGNEKYQDDGEISESESKTSETSFLSLVKLKIDTLTSLNTRRGYEGFLRHFLSVYGEDISIAQINQIFINQYVKDLDNLFSDKPAMKLLMISKIKAIVNFGKESGIIPTSTRIVFPKLRIFHADRNLTVDEIKDLYNSFCVKLKNDPCMKDPKTEALALFILDIAFQGLAPTDMANLKIKDIKFLNLKNMNGSTRKCKADDSAEIDLSERISTHSVVMINTYRKKTGNRVQIVASCKPIMKILKQLMKGKEADDYLLDCFNKESCLNDTQRQNRLANYFYKISQHINRSISNSRRITFYFARHAFCNLADSLDVPRHIIQTLIGHKSSVLEKSYLRAATVNEQYMISEKIFSMMAGMNC